MGKKAKRYTIQKPDKASILDIYKEIAVAAGENPEGRFDSRFICVARNIFEWFKEFMNTIGAMEAIGADWVCYGPKVKDDLPENTVEIEDSFFCQVEKERGKHTIEDIREEYNRLDKVCGVDTSGLAIVVSKRSYRQYGSTTFDRQGNPVKVSIADFILDTENEFWDVIRHEYAHVLVRLRHPGERHCHDGVWKAACLEVGCRTETSSSDKEAAEAAKRKEEERGPKYMLTCRKCGATWNYLRMTKDVRRLLEGKPACLMCTCGWGDFTAKQLR